MPSSAPSPRHISPLSLHDALPISTWQKLGDYDVALTPEFFRALAIHGALTLHVDLLRGQNAHHVVEAVFKAAARALGAATGLDPRRSEEHTSELQSRPHLVCRLLLRRPATSPLFPYTTLFRSLRGRSSATTTSRSRRSSSVRSRSTAP